jgi:hypothetical protein
MTKEFFEVVLSKLINERDMVEIDIENLKGLDISTDEKSNRFILLLKNLTEINNNIESLTGMLPEEVFFKTPQTEDNNNN